MEITPEVHFAQQLASNQVKVREKALKKLGKWLSTKSISSDAFTEDDMLKLWKGIFYYFWNCDKPLFQEDRAEVLSNYIHVFKTLEYSFLYIDTFFLTMAREWTSIDRYRLEKFMMFVRRFLHQCYELLKRQNWKPKCIKQFNKVMKRTVINPTAEGAPLGLKLHVSDIYMEELAKVGSKELAPEAVQLFLVPYCHILHRSEDPSFVSSVKNDVYLYLINQEADEEAFCEFPCLKFDATAVQNLLFKYTNKEGLKRKHLKVIYDIVKQFEDFKSGASAVDSKFSDQSYGRRLKKRAVEKAALSLIEDEEEYSRERKNIKKQKQDVDV